jgi:hypothetical protein
MLNRRLDMVARREDGPFYTAVTATDNLLRACELHVCEVAPYERRICDALSGVLTELARARLHGFTDVRALPAGAW